MCSVNRNAARYHKLSMSSDVELKSSGGLTDRYTADLEFITSLKG